MITQIYAVNNPHDALKLVRIGVDFIGAVVGFPSEFPGIITPNQAKKILLAIGNKAKKTILPFSENIDEIIHIAKLTNPDILHIATEPLNITPNSLKKIKQLFPKMQLMRTIPVIDDSCVNMAKGYEDVADYLLLDSRSKTNHQIGATGETHDWNLSKLIVKNVSTPVILAGGIGPDNVDQAIIHVKPYGVDSKTKTDIPNSNNKDFAKVKSFVNIARNTKIF